MDKKTETKKKGEEVQKPLTEERVREIVREEILSYMQERSKKKMHLDTRLRRS